MRKLRKLSNLKELVGGGAGSIPRWSSPKAHDLVTPPRCIHKHKEHTIILSVKIYFIWTLKPSALLHFGPKQVCSYYDYMSSLEPGLLVGRCHIPCSIFSSTALSARQYRTGS